MSETLNIKISKITILGLGFVGLILAIGFTKRFPTMRFDNKAKKIQEIYSGHVRTMEVEDVYLKSVIPILFSQ